MKWGDTELKWGSGHYCPHPLATTMAKYVSRCNYSYDESSVA